MISDCDVWPAALLMVKRYATGAIAEAESRAAQFERTTT